MFGLGGCDLYKWCYCKDIDCTFGTVTYCVHYQQTLDIIEAKRKEATKFLDEMTEEAFRQIEVQR